MEEHRRARDLLALVAAGTEPPSGLLALLEDHFAFEETVLLPLLAAHLPAGTGPLPVLFEEHRAILGLLRGLDAAPPVEARRRLQGLLLSHLDKEEELIIPFARTQLGPEELARVGCRPSGGRAPECAS